MDDPHEEVLDRHSAGAGFTDEPDLPDFPEGRPSPLIVDSHRPLELTIDIRRHLAWPEGTTPSAETTGV